ncbi:MAG: hypothetical protein ACLPHP_22655 [Candidatus Sulfotelmatobacter sp.]
MLGIWRMVATLLLLATAFALPGAEAMPAVAPAGHAAGCHGHGPHNQGLHRHGPANPVPPSTGYECCVNGHHAAIPNLSFSLRFVAAQVSSLDGSDGPRLLSLLRLNSAVLVFPSNSPPGLVSLRI